MITAKKKKAIVRGMDGSDMDGSGIIPIGIVTFHNTHT